MTMGKPKDKKAGLTMMSAFKYFLKGNMLFALNGTVLTAIDSVICLFPALFQKVYTDNIITQKNPEWFTPLLTIYVLLFVLVLTVWITLSVVRRPSYAKIVIDRASKYLWAVMRLPMTLDNISQHIVIENLARLKCTRIVIAHRLSTIQHCNRIIVLKDGCVAADGTYEELKAPLYLRM